ncbi:hypothetical protein E6O75_ATG07021 [Venturia nashicola]|uniref:Uncharacterized protein n=1 Tax=Venturia nashicola TaxID=86259 RepID=A0A4Z1P5M8_9PEZI|nr:hypothetical protein E6O75_ATG07021 [Venturia nashicola]
MSQIQSANALGRNEKLTLVGQQCARATTVVYGMIHLRDLASHADPSSHRNHIPRGAVEFRLVGQVQGGDVSALDGRSFVHTEVQVRENTTYAKRKSQDLLRLLEERRAFLLIVFRHRRWT